MEIERIRCSPAAITAEVASLLRVRADAKGLPLRIEHQGPIPETILTDPTRLRQILVNVLANAIEFTEVGEVRMVSAFSPSKDEGVLQFDVYDTGIGMSPEQAARLFQPFTQGDASTARRFGGTGLGLTLSKRLAQMLGGELVLLETQPGAGTHFQVRIATGPMAGIRLLDNPSAEPANAPALAAEPDPAGSLEGLRILLAEDGPDNRRLIAHLLKRQGAAVTLVENGEQAVAACRAATDSADGFDVVLMDMQMPAMDGYEATRMLRAQGYRGPVIALTAHAMSGDREKCISAGCNDYATKPVNRAQLLKAIRDQLASPAPA